MLNNTKFDAMHNPFEAFQKMMGDAYARAQTFATEYAAIEQQLVTRAQGAVATWAQMTQDAIAYAAELAAQARKLGLEIARKAGETGTAAAQAATAAAPGAAKASTGA